MAADEAGGAGDEDGDGDGSHLLWRQSTGVLTSESKLIRFSRGLFNPSSTSHAVLPDRSRKRTCPGLVEGVAESRPETDRSRYSRGAVEMAGWEATRRFSWWRTLGGPFVPRRSHRTGVFHRCRRGDHPAARNYQKVANRSQERARFGSFASSGLHESTNQI